MRVCHNWMSVPRTPEKATALRKRSANRVRGLATARDVRNRKLYRSCSRLPDGATREAVLRAVPAKYKSDDWPRLLKRLARNLKAEDPTATPADYAHVVEEWYQLAGPSAGLPKVRANFAEAFAMADGSEPLAFADRVRKIVEANRPKTSEGRVTRVIQLLARTFGRRRFYLSVRVAARASGLSPATCARVLGRLVDRRVIAVVSAGVPNPFDRSATVYDMSGLLAVGERASTSPIPTPKSRTAPGLPTTPAPQPHHPRENLGEKGRGKWEGLPVSHRDDGGEQFGVTDAQRQALEARMRRVRLAETTRADWE